MNNKEIDFLESIYLLNKLPQFYKSITSDLSKTLHYNNLKNETPEIKDGYTLIKDLPEYINIDTKDLPKHIKQINIEHYKGFAINFDGIANVEDYLKSRFGNSSRYKLRRSIKKLENAFDISYKMFYGDVTREDYDFIFDEFFKMLEIRSIEKGILNNRNIQRKDFYHNLVYPLILEKKASLFVIYNGTQPIDVCLNFHAGSLIFQFIRTYDISFSKFNTGYIDLIKQIEWCLNNNIKLITFGYGSYYWKKRWCNYNYEYNYNIFYNKKSFKSIIKAFLKTNMLRLRHRLRESGFIDKFHEVKGNLLNKLKPSKELNIIINNVDFKSTINTAEEIDINTSKYNFIKKHIYDFLFNFNEKEKDIKTFKILNKPNGYLVIGNKNKITISIK